MAENGQNTEKSPVDIRRLAVTLKPLKGHQLTLVRKLARNTIVIIITYTIVIIITYHLVDFAVAENNRVKIKQSKKMDKYFDLIRELKIL